MRLGGLNTRFTCFPTEQTEATGRGGSPSFLFFFLSQWLGATLASDLPTSFAVSKGLRAVLMFVAGNPSRCGKLRVRQKKKSPQAS